MQKLFCGRRKLPILKNNYLPQSNHVIRNLRHATLYCVTGYFSPTLQKSALREVRGPCRDSLPQGQGLRISGQKLICRKYGQINHAPFTNELRRDGGHPDYHSSQTPTTLPPSWYPVTPLFTPFTTRRPFTPLTYVPTSPPGIYISIFTVSFFL